MTAKEFRAKEPADVAADSSTTTSTSTTTATADTSIQAARADVPPVDPMVGDDLDGYLGSVDEEEVSAVDQGVARMDLALEGIDPDDPAATHTAVLDGVSAYRDQLESLPPEERQAFIDASRDQIGALLENAKDMDPEQLQAMVGDLAAAGELVGQDGIEGLVDVLGDGLVGIMESSEFAHLGPGALLGAFSGNMAEGNGALLMSALTQRLGEDESTRHFAVAFQDEQAVVMEQIASQHRDAVAEAERLDGAFANWVANNYELYGEEGIAAAEQAFREEHAEEYARLEERGVLLASVLEGAAYNHENADPSLGMHADWAAEQNQAILEQSVDLGAGYEKGDDGVWRRSSLRDQVFGDALLRSGDGEGTWLDAAHDLGSDRPGLNDELVAAEQQAAFTISQALTVEGKFDQVGTLLQGLGVHNPEFAEVGDAIAERLAELQAKAEAGEIDFENASELLVEAFQDGMEGLDIPDDVRDRVMAMGLGVQGAMAYVSSIAGRDQASWEDWLDNGAGALGILNDTDKIGGPGLGRVSVLASGLNLIANINDFVQGDGDFALAVKTLWGAGSVADDLLKLMTGSGSKLMQTIGLPVGLALAGIDLVNVIANGGSAEEIAVASLPLVGAGVGAAIGVWFFGVGAGVGAGIGLAVGGALQFLSGLFGIGRDDPREEYAEDTRVLTEAALQAVLPPGTSEEVVDMMTDELSRVNDDFVGVGPVIGLVAEQMGVSPTEFLGQLAELAGGENGQDMLEQLVRDGLLSADTTNMDEIREAREKIRDGEEVDIPELEFEQSDVNALASIFGQAFRTGEVSATLDDVENYQEMREHNGEYVDYIWEDSLRWLEYAEGDGVAMHAETVVFHMSAAAAAGDIDQYVSQLGDGRGATDLLEMLDGDPKAQAQALDLLLQSGSADEVQAWAEANGVDVAVALGGVDQDPDGVAQAVRDGTFDPVRMLANVPEGELDEWIALYDAAGLDTADLVAQAATARLELDRSEIADLAQRDPDALGELFRDKEQSHSGLFNNWDPKTGEMTPILAAVATDPDAARAFVEGYLAEADRDSHGGNTIENMLKAYDEHGSAVEVELALQVLEQAGYGSVADAWREEHQR